LLRFSVQDTGIGITPEQKKSLFRPFTQADTSTTRKYGGTGLGLAICKNIVTMMKGAISCESQPNQGTTFTFTARFGLPLEGELLEDFSEIRTDALLLGDRRDSLTTIRNFLELLKSHVVAQYETKNDFEQFLKKDRLNEIDFIIFDFDDWEGSGAAMYELFRDSNPQTTPLIAFSNHPALEHLLTKWNLTHKVQILQKPVAVSELFNILMSVTSEKKKAMIEAKKQTRTMEASHRVSTKFELPKSVRGAKILLAEDNRINQMVATEMLKMEGFNVDVAVNGRAALEMLEKGRYDLVLMDIQMPEMDGLEATKIIRANPQYKNLPILAMTAHAMTGDREQSLEVGMNDHITKPIDPTLLFSTIAKWIRR
jgi:CheY-like chemotaxis protein